MDRSNHYEAAVEAYLRHHRLCYVAVDESRRAVLDEGTVKSLDFVVYGALGARLLVDVKGRRFPGGPDDRPRRHWENWATREDVECLGRWAARFGPGYRGVLLFTYLLADDVDLPDGTPDLWAWRDRRYLLRAVAVDDYRQRMRVRSPRWDTVCLPRAAYREVARPFCRFALDPGPVARALAR
jgi:hypothetical protein